MAKGIQVGLSNVVYAIMLTDVAGGAATYSPKVALSGAISANINPNASNDTLFADDGPYETASTVGAISMELNLADLDATTQAALLGHTLDAKKQLVKKVTDAPPWVAIGFKSMKSNGKFRYVWLYKGKFATPEMSNQTKGDSINWNTPTITGNFVKRECDNAWQIAIDEDDSPAGADLTAFLAAPVTSIVV